MTSALDRRMQNKVPLVTLAFWVIKILATTLGETGGDTVTMTMNLGYLTGTAINVQSHGLRQIALRHGRDGASNFRGRPEKIFYQRVNRDSHLAPRAA